MKGKRQYAQKLTVIFQQKSRSYNKLQHLTYKNRHQKIQQGSIFDGGLIYYYSFATAFWIQIAFQKN